jgi:hypothetical protein
MGREGFMRRHQFEYELQIGASYGDDSTIYLYNLDSLGMLRA